MVTLNEIGRTAYESAKLNGWHEARKDENHVLRETSTPERLALIHSEVSEGLEAFRKHGSLGWYGEDDKPEGLASELADIIIRTCELAEWFSYDLEVEVLEKMRWNTIRTDVPVKEGGKSL
jgi:NTP pyrophosphatase (non-canonical NTP hydrolase)